jgi:flagellar assembly protein FliH
MSGIITKEELTSYKRWNIDSFDTKPVTAPAVQAAPAGAEIAAPAQPGESTAAGTTASDNLGEVMNEAISLPTAEEIERIHEEARSTGYEAGFAEGKLAGEKSGEEAARKALKQEADRLAQMIGNLQKSLNEMDQTVADQVLALALEVAAQLMHGALKAEESALLPVVREAIATLPMHHGHILLHLHPDDAANVRELIGEQLTHSNTQIIENSEITRGGCLLKTGASEVDATTETRWKRVLEAIGLTPEDWLPGKP